MGTSPFADAFQATWVSITGSQDTNAYIHAYSTAISRSFASELTAQTEPRPALRAQSCEKKIVTEVPKVAVWLLVAANILFVLLALGFAGLAVHALSPTTHQVAVRLNIAGLTAHVFEGEVCEEEGWGE